MKMESVAGQQSFSHRLQNIHNQFPVSFRKSLTALVLVTGLVLQSRADLISDGSFEATIGGVPINSYSLFTGSLGDGWVVTQGEILVERGSLDGIAHSGNQFVYLDGDFNLNTLSQTVATTPGQNYIISFWVADSNPNFLQVTFGGQTLFNGTAPASGGGFPATGYVQEDFTATAASATSILSISGQYTSGGTGTVLDDVIVAPVPEPSTFLLMGGGVVFLALIELRRPKVSA
jgi:hypothetical protein